jgi:predicted transcriptional regulator
MEGEPSNVTPSEIEIPRSRLGAIMDSLADLSTSEKLELIERIACSIRVVPLTPAEREERVRRQRENLRQTMRELAALPPSPLEDGLTNRDHDQILYGSTK